MVLNGAGEALPVEDKKFDLVLSHEVLEHVADDRRCLEEMVRVLKPGGRLVLFVPNRGYPFETHGIYWRGKYHFGNIFGVNYLPRKWRNKLAPHVRVYSGKDLAKLMEGLPVRVVEKTVIFGAYDNIIARNRLLGNTLKRIPAVAGKDTDAGIRVFSVLAGGKASVEKVEGLIVVREGATAVISLRDSNSTNQPFNIFLQPRSPRQLPVLAELAIRGGLRGFGFREHCNYPIHEIQKSSLIPLQRLPAEVPMQGKLTIFREFHRVRGVIRQPQVGDRGAA